MVEAVLKSSTDRMQRRSQMRMKQEHRGVATALRTRRPEGAPQGRGPRKVEKILGITRHVTFIDAIAQSMYCRFR